MKRTELEHVIRASAAIANQTEFVVLGTAALLATVPDPPNALAQTRDVDLYPLRDPGAADLIEGSIGELSPFDKLYGYYAQGVGPETATLPDGWQGRLVPIQNANTHGAIAYCLEPHDLAASKLYAFRHKDREFVALLLHHQIIDAALLGQRIDNLVLPDDLRAEFPEHHRAMRSWLSRTMTVGPAQVVQEYQGTPAPDRGRGT